MSAKINELLYALEKLNPEKYQALKQQYPAHQHLFAEGVELGESDEKDSLLNYANMTISAAEGLIKNCDVKLSEIRKRIVLQKRLTLLSQVISTIGSATVVTSLLAKPEQHFVTLAFGLVTLIASVIPPINDYLLTGLNNRKITESFDDLVKVKLNLTNFNQELNYQIHKKEKDEQKISELIASSNQEAAVMTRILIVT